MDYQDFKKLTREIFGDFYSEQVDYCFEKAVEFAQQGDFETSIKIGKDAFALSKFANLDYEKLYLIGLLCELHLDKGQPELAEAYFKFGMNIIDAGEDSFNDDVNSFLDLKIEIEKGLNKSLHNNDANKSGVNS